MGKRSLKYEVLKPEKGKTREVIKNILIERISLAEEEWCKEDENCGLLQGVDGK